jgi:hypothetical protein
MRKSNKAYERRESVLINRIARDTQKLKRMQKGEVKRMRKKRY